LANVLSQYSYIGKIIILGLGLPDDRMSQAKESERLKAIYLFDGSQNNYINANTSANTKATSKSHPCAAKLDPTRRASASSTGTASI
jgi:hypothetical protein